ncbi:MAG: hypothetical protein Q7U57_10865 [Methylovulum sp.]|nr:hypothetical protein [Methylovulum sp.]
MSIIRLLLALCVAAISLPAGAVKVTVHNQGHYFVSFEVNGRHSGNFGVGQSRTMENASGKIRLNWLPGFTWCSNTAVYFPNSNFTYLEGIELLVGQSDIYITFENDIFSPEMLLRGFDKVRRITGYDKDGFPKYIDIDLNRTYSQGVCTWKI